MSNSRKILIIAGENSGDLHASNLVKQLKRLDPTLEFIGLGGNQMKSAGVRLILNIVDRLAIIGFVEVLSKVNKIRRLFRRVRTILEHDRPCAAILIDYPGFNLRVARIAKSMGIAVIYYISPHVWAWRKGRIREIAKYVDKMLVIFPFEEGIYREAGVDVTYVGHPSLDVMKLTMTKEQVFERFQFDPNKKLIGLLPGSRKPEVERLLPVMLEAAEMIKARIPDVQFVIPRASTVKKELIDYYIENAGIEVHVVDAHRYNVRSAMDFAIVASGTATLETAFLVCPMVILYKTSFLTWIIAKNLVSLPYIGLVNVVAGDMAVPELLQNEATPLNVANRVVKILSNPKEIETIRYELEKVKEKMGGPGASKRAAEQVFAVINQRTPSPVATSVATP